MSTGSRPSCAADGVDEGTGISTALWFVAGLFPGSQDDDAAPVVVCLCISSRCRLGFGNGSVFDGSDRRIASRDIVGDGLGVAVDDGTPLDLDLSVCCVSTGDRMRLHSPSGRSKGSILVSFVEVGLVDVGLVFIRIG